MDKTQGSRRAHFIGNSGGAGLSLRSSSRSGSGLTNANSVIPGQVPFTRGVQPTMYRGRPWTMRQYAGMGDAEESNKRYKFPLLAQGHLGPPSVAFDLPTQIGYDSDDPMAIGEVGKVGVAIDSIEDMQQLFEGIDLETISTSMTINATASILLALYVAVGKRAGATVRKLSGTVQNDILKEYIARGTYIFPPRHAIRIITDLFAFSSAAPPGMERDLHFRLSHAYGKQARPLSRRLRSRWPMAWPTWTPRSGLG